MDGMMVMKNLRTKMMSEADGEMKLSIPCFAHTMGKQIKRLKDVPYDVKLQVGPDKQVVEAHKEVLKDMISYFTAMFSGNFQESTQQVIELPDIECVEAVRKLVDFLYKGTLTVSGQDVQDLFQVCDVWGMDNVKSKCVSFMVQKMDCHNCLELQCLGELYSIQVLVDTSRELISREFQIISKLKSFVELPAPIMMSLVQRNDLNLGHPGEDCMVEAVTRWVRHDLPRRWEYLGKCIPHLRLSLCSKPVLEDFVSLDPETVKEDVEKRLKFDPRCDTLIRPRKHKENIMVFCGYSHTRSGPNSPKLKTVEKFNLQTLKSETTELPDAPSYGVALNLMGKIVYIALHEHTDSATNKRTVHTRVYTMRPEQPSVNNRYRRGYEVFSDKAIECITKCLISRGSVVYCPVKNLIYAVDVNNVISINVTCSNGRIFCDYNEKSLANLKAVLKGQNYSGCRSICHKENLYFIGGAYGPEMEPCYSRNAYVLSQDGSSWKEVHFMNMHRTEFAAASYDDTIVVSGGYGGKNSLRRLQNCEVYHPGMECWSPFLSLKQSKSHHCMVVANGVMYAIAGKTYSSQKLSDSGGWLPGGARIVSSLIERFEDSLTEPRSWERFGRLNQARCMFSVVVV